MSSEFHIIEHFFNWPTTHTVLGVGDDCALICPQADQELAITTDTLISGVHFFPDVLPSDLGHKALAVNLSDLAAMGANPRWMSLALTLPSSNEIWLKQFVVGFESLAKKYDIDLIGGDLTHGTLAITITVMGNVDKGTALRRDGAKPGDQIWVSGTIGDAAATLLHLRQHIKLEFNTYQNIRHRLHRPEPRIELGAALRGIAHSCIDISDGMLADLGHILERSHVGANIEFPKIPLSRELKLWSQHQWLRQAALAGGDDYELCFTAAAESEGIIKALSQKIQIPLTQIGTIVREPGLRVTDEFNQILTIPTHGYDHFAQA